ncbi:MAG: pyridoxamine 5'-phosphate oxidase family protein [Nocardioidaceae bacterium]
MPLFEETGAMTSPLSPTARTQVRRSRERGLVDRRALFDLLATGLVCHLGVVIDGAPRVLPTAYAVDQHGPDRGGTLYLHGSVAARSLLASADSELCVTVTIVDGLVLARSGFHHSMNYRSAVVMGRGRLVDDADERLHALDLVVDHVVPGRAATMRAHTRKELAATMVVALPLHEASVKARTGGPIDEPSDVASGVWAGVLPLAVTAGDLLTDAEAAGVTPPEDVRRRAAVLRPNPAGGPPAAD